MSLKEWLCMHKWKRIDRILEVRNEFKSSDGCYDEKTIDHYIMEQCEKCGWKYKKYDKTMRETIERT